MLYIIGHNNIKLFSYLILLIYSLSYIIGHIVHRHRFTVYVSPSSRVRFPFFYSYQRPTHTKKKRPRLTSSCVKLLSEGKCARLFTRFINDMFVYWISICTTMFCWQFVIFARIKISINPFPNHSKS